MAGAIEDRNRQVIPRWRSFQSTIAHGELSTLKPPKEASDPAGQLDELLQDWADSKGISTAADLVSVAFVNGRESDAAEAARFLLTCDGVPYGAKSVAALCLRNLGETGPDIEASAPRPEADEPTVEFHSALERMFRVRIHAAREQLAAYPRNPVLWSNLARLYTSVGSQAKAERAIRVALALAPDNRFVLRAASRLLLHQGDSRQAQRLLTAAPSLHHDPWVLSAEIATTAALGRVSKHVKDARKVLASGRFSPFHVSELASALGTLEAAEGNRRSSRLLIEQSLRQPSENAVAQAAWVSRQTGIVTATGIDVTRSAEAVAWQAFREADWDRSLKGTHDWLADQPFSSRPAVHGSHISATVLEDYDQAVEFAQFGLLSNPDDVCLYNNLAFALAQQGEIERAAQVMGRINTGSFSKGHAVYVMATLGLIEFRSGRAEQGRTLYRRALEDARVIGDERKKLPLVYLAFEELRIASPHAEKVRQEAIEATANMSEPWCQTVVERLRKYRPPLQK